MASVAGLLLFLAGLGLVIAGAEVFFDGLLASAARIGLPAFVLTVVISGFELENLAAGIATNLKGLGNAAAGTFLGGTTFLALGVAGLGALIAGIAYAGRSQLGDQPPRRPRYAIPRMLAGLAVLSGAGVALGEGLHRIVTNFHVSASLLGNTAVAATVEVEEVSRVAVPTRRGRGDIALGNIFGTIAHFAAFNAGVIALVRPIHLDRATLHLHLPAATASVLVLAALTAFEQGLSRLGGLLLLALYAGYVAAAITLSA